ncbi:hypothetical protein BEH_11830 [Priestia filamentosa]|uniref:Uncharacterized protein n=1 Tax=Priestia filamentosa TaxID=1402861 RepID=A0A0H4KGN3_9BACI|nr:hypothetical protein [Priestia filamentosa]AKO92720.1 hypothetical protein BEH_11830 [Priestia filamentosa]
MISYIDVIGEKETTFYTFDIRIEKNNIIVSSGEYYNQGNLIFSTTKETILTVPEAGSYQIWIYPDGIKLIKGVNTRSDYINILSYFEVPEESSSIELLKVRCIRTVLRD